MCAVVMHKELSATLIHSSSLSRANRGGFMGLSCIHTAECQSSSKYTTDDLHNIGLTNVIKIENSHSKAADLLEAPSPFIAYSMAPPAGYLVC